LFGSLSRPEHPPETSGVGVERKDAAVIGRQRLFLAISRAEEDQPKPGIDCRRRPDIATTAILCSSNAAFSVGLVIYLEPPNQTSGLCIEGYETTTVRYLELDATGVGAEE